MRGLSFVSDPLWQLFYDRSRTVAISCGTVFFFLITLSGFSLFALPEENQPISSGLESMVPAGSPFFTKCSGIEQLLSKGQSLDLIRLWNDSEVQAFLAEAKEEIPYLLEGEGSSRFPFKEIWTLLRGEISLAWCGGLPVVQGDAVPQVAISMNMGDGKGAFLESLGNFLDVVAWANNLKQGELSHREFDLCYIGLPEKGIAFTYTTVQNLFVATLSPDFLKEIIDHHLDDKPVLADDPVFQRCMARIEAEGIDGLIFTNFKSLLEILNPLFGPETGDWLANLGLTHIEALCMATSLGGGGSKDWIYLDCPSEETGFLKALFPHPVDRGILRKTPPDTLFFLDMAVDPQQVVGGVKHFLEKASPDDHEKLCAALNAIKEQIGLDVEKDCLGVLGKEIAFYMTLPKSVGLSVVPDLFMSISLADEEGFLSLREKLLPALEGKIKVVESSYGDMTLHHITLPDPGIPLSPTFAVEGGRLLVTSTTMTMKKYLKWLGSGKPGLDEAEDFKKVIAHVPEEVSLLEFFNLRQSIEIGYGMASPFLPAVLSGEDIPLDPAMLPMTETITDYISNAACYMMVDEKGLLLSWYCPLGFGALLSMAVSAMDYIAEKDLFQGLMAQRTLMERTDSVVYLQYPELGEAYTLKQDGEYERADQRFTRWIEAHPNEGRSLVWAVQHRGDCRMKLERFKEAVEDFRIVAEKDPNSRGLAFYDITRAYAAMNDPEQAVTYLEKAIGAGFRVFEDDTSLVSLREEPRFSVFMDMVLDASNLMRDGLYDEAAKLLTEWIFNNPHHELEAWALKNRGECFLSLEQYLDAIADYENAAKKSDSYKPSLFYSIACIYSTQNEKERAVQYLKQALDAGFDDYDLIAIDGDLDNIRNEPGFKALGWSWFN